MSPAEFEVSPPAPDKHHDIRCCMCGHWITSYHYGSMFEGRFIDFMNKNCGSIIMTFCNECTSKIMELTGEDEGDIDDY